MNKSTQNIRKKFRHTDLLLLDDIQFLAGKEKVQEELFHTFNALIDGGGQIVFSSDRPPSEIKKIEARLASRFEGGLTVDIQPPDFELRTAILMLKSRKRGNELDPELAKMIAERIENTRALEGFLLKLATVELAKSGPITRSDVFRLLGEKQEKEKFLHPDTVVDAVCNFYNIKSTQLKGDRRDAIFVKPRQICMYLLKQDLRLSFKEIGNLLGGRDHTTVMHGVDKMAEGMTREDRLKKEVMHLRKLLAG
jgi:chromosomal replication initiator protein